MIATKSKYTINLKDIFTIYKTNGHFWYDDEISQIQHALQTVYWAEQDTSDISMLFAAFIHDLGHLIPDAPFKGQFGVVDHHKLGADYLSHLGFNHKICNLVMLHIEAKRYLATTSKEYFDKLSDTDIVMLDLQGGLMNQKEEERFLKNPLASQSLQLRVWDDKAHDPDLSTRDLEYYEDFFTQNAYDLMQ